MLAYLRMTWVVGRFALRTRASLADAMELHALCALAMSRARSPTAKMFIGQVRAKARRMHAATARPRDWYVPPPPPARPTLARAVETAASAG